MLFYRSCSSSAAVGGWKKLSIPASTSPKNFNRLKTFLLSIWSLWGMDGGAETWNRRSTFNRFSQNFRANRLEMSWEVCHLHVAVDVDTMTTPSSVVWSGVYGVGEATGRSQSNSTLRKTQHRVWVRLQRRIMIYFRISLAAFTFIRLVHDYNFALFLSFSLSALFSLH